MKPADESEVETQLKRRILTTQGVTELISFEGSFDASERRFHLSFEAMTEGGPTGTVAIDV